MKIKVIITGATGMVGKGVLLECLESKHVEEILVIGRNSVNIKHDKLKEILVHDFFDLSTITDLLKDYNVCYFCLGISAFRMNENDYSKITHDLTIHFAKTLLSVNKNITFCYVSGEGTDSSEQSKTMWARVKGRTENELLKMRFKKKYMFRPAYIQPKKGIKSKTPIYNGLYLLFKPLYPILKKIFPNYTTSTTNIGKAMINIIRRPYLKKYIESIDINLLAQIN